jgi:hypothetical protein
MNSLRTSLTVAFALSSLFVFGTTTVSFATTTGQTVSACKHHPKRCTVTTGSGGDSTIVTGSGRVVWCPPESSGKCVTVDPGRNRP